MKERQIPFSAPMVRALLADTKTQTRRVMKVQPPSDEYLLVTCLSTTGSRRDEGKHQWHKSDGSSMVDRAQPYFSSPYGYPGDRLWVREAWHASRKYDGLPPREIPNTATVEYDADDYRGLNGRFRQSMFMPRWASRITLEVVGVRVERLQDISVADAIAEGLTARTKDGRTIKYGIPDMDGNPGTDDIGWPWGAWHLSARGAYRKLWESINGPGSWDANPWVWVVEFKRVQP